MNDYQNKHTIAGVLSIISGGLGVIGAITLIAAIFLVSFFATVESSYESPWQEDGAFLIFIALFYGILGLIYVALGILGIVGGIFCLKKKHWGLSLAAAIAGAITFFPCGIAAIVFTALAKPEFQTATPPAPPSAPLYPPEHSGPLS